MKRSSAFASFLGVALCVAAVVPPSPAIAKGRVQLDVSVGTPYALAGRRQTVFLKVGLTGGPIDASARPPVNVALVLDRSGSMSGEKLAKMKDAAIMAIDRLGDQDIASVVAYNHTVSVLVPATRLSDRRAVKRQIERLTADGYTALFAGVGKGAFEVRKFLDENRVNRVILLSDGLANVGPSSVGELADLGRSLGREGISVTTIGLGHGYNEDLMVELARASDGNHAFAETARDLSSIFSSELGDVTSVAAREATVRIRFPHGARPVRVLGRQAEISGNEVVATLRQVYAGQQKYVLIEVEVPATAAGLTTDLAEVSVRYVDPFSRTTDDVSGRAGITFTDSVAVVDSNRDRAVTESSVEMIANENNKRATELRDQGRVEEARRALQENSAFLGGAASTLKSPKLESLKTSNDADIDNVEKNWPAQRKAMRKKQFEVDQQQAW
jgi:Ca-activated chloride channel family protein